MPLELDLELQSGEEPRVCLELRIVLRAVPDACLVLFDEHLAEADRRAGDEVGEGLSRFRGGGGDLDGQVDAEAAVDPLEHAPRQPFADERALEEEGDHGSEEVPGKPGEIERGDMNESSLAIEAAFQADAVEVGGVNR